MDEAFPRIVAGANERPVVDGLCPLSGGHDLEHLTGR
jgi:hypothetical protein